MENLFYLIALLALGKISRSVPAFPENTPAVLNQFVLYLSLPATILVQMNGLQLRHDFMALILVPWGLLLLTIFTVRAASRILQWEPRLTGAVMLSVALGNTSFFGFPAVSAFFGESALKYAILYDQLGTFLALAIFGTIVVSIYGSGTRLVLSGILKKIFFFPPFVALVIGLILMHTTYPQVLSKVLEGLAATLVPIVTFSVGTQMNFRQPLHNIFPIVLTLVLKMVAFPLLVLAVLIFSGIRGPVLQISVFEAAMPPMVMAGILAAAGNLKAEVSHAAIGYGILLSFFTLPLFYFLIGLAG